MEDRVQGWFVTKAEGANQHDAVSKLKPSKQKNELKIFPASHKPVAEITTSKKAPRNELSRMYLKSTMQTKGATITAGDPITSTHA